MKSALGIDIGGTRIKGVVINDKGQLLEQLIVSTGDRTDQNWIMEVKQVALQLIEKIKDEVIIGLSAPGIPNVENTCISYLPGRLEGLENLNWSDLFGYPTWVANDAIAAMAAEARFGEAVNHRHAILLTLGTGVGGAILIDGKIYQGAFQKAGHLGHITMDSEGENDICNLPGSLEDAIGNCTIKKRSLGIYDFTHQLIGDYRKGDPFATWLWLSSVRKLAIGIASLTNVLSPEVVILSGGITEAGNDLFEPLESFFSKYEWRAGGNRTLVRKAKYGDLAGAIGAASFALMKTDKNI